MIHFPNAKINLGLHIIARRPDGYHELETVFYPVKWRDGVEIIPATSGKGECLLEVKGADFGDYRDNLCYKAYQLLNGDFNLPSVNCYLHKVIPHGAGLGGGSSDAASVLIILNSLFNLQLNDQQLLKYAFELGSDCSFFIYNKPMMAKGRGELLQPVDVSLQKYFIVIVMPPVMVSTKEAYGMISPEQHSSSLDVVIQLPVHQWKNALVNDFEKPVFEKYPVIKEVKEKLYISGAVYASMSGSGSSVFGIFDKAVDLENDFPDCSVWQGQL
jgi:4-diphosphocytidyl-2-C-methyl-D-erythritol kinase